MELDNSIPCAVYNASKGELVALFKSMTLASKYIYGFGCHMNKISHYVNTKGMIKANKTILGYNVSVRKMQEKYSDVLGCNDYVVMEGYAQPHSGFSNRVLIESRPVYAAELSRKKNQ